MFFLTGAGSVPSGYSISRSLRFNDDDSAYLTRTPAGAGNRRTFTLSAWVKRGNLASSANMVLMSSNSGDLRLLFNNDELRFTDGTGWDLRTTAVYRDVAAWYHVVLRVDTTQAAAGDRARIYVNNVEQTYQTSTRPAQNTDTAWNQATAHNIGRRANTATEYFDGYMAEVHFVDGTALEPTTFGEADTNTGAWKPKPVTGVTYGTNGFWLSFANAASTTTISQDDAGGSAGAGAGSNDWTATNISVTAGSGNDSLTDTPTNNYPTPSPLDRGSTSAVLANGNLDVSYTSVAVSQIVKSTFALPSSGQWYWEVTLNTNSNGNACFGVANAERSPDTTPYSTTDIHPFYPAATGSGTRGRYASNVANSASGTQWGKTATGFGLTTYGFAYDASTGNLYIRDDTGWMNSSNSNDASPTSAMVTLSTSIFWVPMVGHDAGLSQSTATSSNYGQRAFAYTTPTGYTAICTSNLSTPSILRPSSRFNAAIYTGSGSSRSITGIGHQPDLVWIKSRAGSDNHRLFDAVRGAGIFMSSNSTGTDTTDATTVTSFDADGFSIGADSSSRVNVNTTTYVVWCWDEAVAAGFDIVSYTGNGSNRTINHSLGVAPKLMIIKRRSNSAGSWRVYHASANASPGTGCMFLEGTQGFTSSSVFNNTAPTSTVFSTGTDPDINANGETYIAYLWAEVVGFSRFGKYIGNASSDGPFVHCGFRPRFVIVKRSDSGGDNWRMKDRARATYNEAQLTLYPSTAGGDGSGSTEAFDFLANGFKIRTSDGSTNASGGTFIFAAFAEHPFKYSPAV